MQFSPAYTRPWSLAKTPVMANPRLPIAGGDGHLMGKETLAAAIRQMQDPVPWHYIENGFVIWEGPSPVDGAPLVAIVTGVRETELSGNVKTGAMLQTWIMRSDISPQAALDTGGDVSICGHCKHRGFELDEPKRIKRKTVTARQAGLGWGISGGHPAVEKWVKSVMGGRACYVVVAQAPQAIWKKYRRGLAHPQGPAAINDRGDTVGYPKMPEQELPLLGWGRIARLGSYGDPAMVPGRVWRLLTWNSLGWTGYTHQWCDTSVQNLKPFVMASVDTEEEMHRARSMGWRTFRVLRGDEQLLASVEMSCPASAEAGHKITCDACRVCQGSMPGKKPWRERAGVKGVALKVHPRWTVLYWPRGPKGKRIRGYRPDAPPTKKCPKRKPTEIMLVDYLAGTEVPAVNKLLKKAEASRDPAAVISAGRGEFPGYLQSYFDSAGVILASKGKVRPNPTKAEAILEEAIRPCMTREEAHHAASSIERSLAAVQRHKVVPERIRGKIAKLNSQARGSETPRGRIRALSAANRMLQQLRTYGAGSRRPSRGYKRKDREGKDPRLGHLFHGPALGEGALDRRRAYESELVMVNPRAAHELRRLVNQKRIELDDAKYFNHAAPAIASLSSSLRLLEGELAEAEGAVDQDALAGLGRTGHEIEDERTRAGSPPGPRRARGETVAGMLRRGSGECPGLHRLRERVLSPSVQEHVDSCVECARDRANRNPPMSGIQTEVIRSTKYPWMVKVRVSGTAGRISVRGESQGIHLGLHDPADVDHTFMDSILTVNRADGSGRALTYAARRKVVDAAARAVNALEPHRNPRIRSNPLLAIVGNPGTRQLVHGLEGGPGRIDSMLCGKPLLAGSVHVGPERGHEVSCPECRHLIKKAVARKATGGPGWTFAQSRYNPGPGNVDPRAFMARDRYRADLNEPGHEDAAEYWRGQAGAFFVANPGNPRGRRGEFDRHHDAAMQLVHAAVRSNNFDALHDAHEHVRAAYRCCTNPPNPEDLGVLDAVLAEIAGAEGVLVEAAYRGERKAVARSGKRSRVKGKAKKRVKKNFKATAKKSSKPRKKRYTLEEARKKFKGFDKAIKAYRRFHDREPGHVDVFELEDGESVVTVDDVHAALHRTLETNYIVPWDSNKKGSYWKHEHIEGAMEGKIDPLDRIEDLPLEVFDVKRNRTIKLPNGRWYLTDWWRERKGRGENRVH